LYLCPSDQGGQIPLARTDLAGTWQRGNYGANAGTGLMYLSPINEALCKKNSNGSIVENVPHFNGSSLYAGLAFPGGGAFAVNTGIKLDQITDGTSHTVMIDELRIGPSANDLRGTWAMGQAGASIAAGNGRTDGPGPNISLSGYDDIQGGDNRPEIGMGVWSQPFSNQVTAKSRHIGGVLLGFCDGGVRFVRNGITQPLWFFLHSRHDGQTLNGAEY
jgi:hypothetical protein